MGETAMLLFTAKTRRLIDRAVQELPDEPKRRVWNSWVREHPKLRVPGGPVDDGDPPPPRVVILVALSALEELEATKRRRLATAGLSEDEASDLESDLSYIVAVSRQLNQLPAG
jgi:hypothetical protein